MSAPSSIDTHNDVDNHIRLAAEALVDTVPTPRPVVVWLQREHGLNIGEACKAVGIANILRRDRKTRPEPEAVG